MITISTASTGNFSSSSTFMLEVLLGFRCFLRILITGRFLSPSTSCLKMVSKTFRVGWGRVVLEGRLLTLTGSYFCPDTGSGQPSGSGQAKSKVSRLELVASSGPWPWPSVEGAWVVFRLRLLKLWRTGSLGSLRASLANRALAWGPLETSPLLFISNWLINEVEEAKLSERRSSGADMSPLWTRCGF